MKTKKNPKNNKKKRKYKKKTLKTAHNHHFKTEIAEKYGIIEALLLENIAYFMKTAEEKKRNYFCDYYWYYCSVSDFQKQFCYLSHQQVERHLKKLIQKKILATGNFNKKNFDKTKWYTIIDNEIRIIYNLDLKKMLDKWQVEYDQNEEFKQQLKKSKADVTKEQSELQILLNIQNDFEKKYIKKQV